MATIPRWRRATVPDPVAVDIPIGPRVDVAAIDRDVLRLFEVVIEHLAAATAAFLGGDRDAAAGLVASEPTIDTLHLAIESLVVGELGRRAALDDEELRLLLLVLRIVPELERSADLVEHVALRTGHGLDRTISPKARGLIAEMGRVGSEMWRTASKAYATRDADAAALLRVADDEMDDLHVRLTAELGAGTLSPSAAIELGLVARFLERLGDHAVNVTRRLSPAPAASGGRL